jgi:hypothetical protein
MVFQEAGRPFYGTVFHSISSKSSAHLFLSSEVIEQTTEYCKTRDNYQLAYFFFSFRETEKQKASNLAINPGTITRANRYYTRNNPGILRAISTWGAIRERGYELDTRSYHQISNVYYC